MEENKKENMTEINTDIPEEKTQSLVQEEEQKKESGRYKTIMTLDKNLWTYGSPIIFENCILERDQVSNKNRLTLSFTNIYEKDIRDVYLTIFMGDENGNVEELEHSYVALGQKYLSTKGKAAKIHIKNEDAVSFDIRIDRVVFEDGSIWEKEDAILESAGEMDDIEVFAQAKMKDYEDNYAIATEEIGKDDCASISNGIEILKRITWYENSAEMLKHAKRKYKVAKQTEERKQAREDKIAKRKQAVKKKYLTAGVSVGIVALLVALSIVSFFIPNKKYKAAQKDMKAGKTEKAIKEFDGLNGFLKSEDYLAECYYNMGLQAINDGDEKKAEEYFQKAYDSSAKSDYGVMAGAFLDYYKGVEALAGEDYDTALKLFESSTNAASDFNLMNKAGAAMAQVAYHQEEYEKAWNTIKNVYAKDESYQDQYGEYGYGYAKMLVDSGKIKEGMEIYNTISKYTKEADLNEGIYNQAVALAEKGKTDEALKLLENIKDGYKKAKKLYTDIAQFEEKVQYWVGTWKHKGKVNGEKKTYRIKISTLLYKGEMCIKIKDQNNKKLGYETVISSKNHVTQITIGTYMLHFKLKRFQDQKFTYTLKGAKKMIVEQKYAGNKYTTKYKK